MKKRAAKQKRKSSNEESYEKPPETENLLDESKSQSAVNVGHCLKPRLCTDRGTGDKTGSVVKAVTRHSCIVDDELGQNVYIPQNKRKECQDHPGR